MPDPTPAEEMETAAEIVLATAAATSDTPWNRQGNYVHSRNGCVAIAYLGGVDAIWMALTDPEIGPLIAAVLKGSAQTWKEQVRIQVDGQYHEACDGVAGEDCECFVPMLELAQHIRDKAVGRG
ncbi:hypothetical protein [Nonomuraea sp. NPDC049141]|uniref:hypothetical protein n=1 Tax=Nonomuraea sp. NPDC049141 TaxID=3155500 RepID=UPI0033EB8F40